MTDQPKSYAEFNEGDNYKGEQITSLFAAKPEYLIFEGDSCGEITIATENPVLIKRCSEISLKISIITEYLITKREKRRFVARIGLAYVEAIEGNTENANKICDKIIDRIEQYKSNKGRFYYLLTCLSIVVIALIVSYIQKRYKFIPEIIPHFYIMTYASIGGFLSIAKDIKKIHIDSSDYGWFQIFYGATRILISMFSGLIVYVLVKSEQILPGLSSQDNIYIVCILAIAAGFSETLIPNLLKKIEDEKTGNK